MHELFYPYKVASFSKLHNFFVYLINTSKKKQIILSTYFQVLFTR